MAKITDGLSKTILLAECAGREDVWRDRIRYPANADQAAAAGAGLTPEQLDYVVFYEKPFLKFERLLETYVAFAPRGFRSFSTAIPPWIREKLFQKDLLRRKLQELHRSLE